MNKLNSEELLNIRGGAIKWIIVATIGVCLTFLIGVVDGIIRPLKCNKQEVL